MLGTVAFLGNGGGILSELSRLETRACEQRIEQQMPKCSISEKKSHGCDDIKCWKVFDMKLRFRFCVATIESRLSEVKRSEPLVHSDTTEAHLKIAGAKMTMVIMLFTLALCRTFPGSFFVSKTQYDAGDERPSHTERCGAANGLQNCLYQPQPWRAGEQKVCSESSCGGF